MNTREAFNRIREKHCQNNNNKAQKCQMTDEAVNACQDKCMYGVDSCEYMVAMEALSAMDRIKEIKESYDTGEYSGAEAWSWVLEILDV